MDDTTRPAQLLHPLKRYRNYAVWGFPIDNDLIIAGYEKKLASNVNEHEFDILADHMDQYTTGLSEKCLDIWDSPIYPEIVPVRPDSKSKDEDKWVMALVECTRPEDRFLPPPKKIEEIRTVFIKLGFKEGPGWFIGIDI